MEEAVMAREKGFYPCYELRPWIGLLLFFKLWGMDTPCPLPREIPEEPSKWSQGKYRVLNKRQRNQNVNARLPKGWLASRGGGGGPLRAQRRWWQL